MARTAHHRVKNTLNSVSLMLTRLARRITEPSAHNEIQLISDHIKNYSLIHDLLSELESDQDAVGILLAIERWALSQQSEFQIRENHTATNIATNGTGSPVALATFASSVLQLLVEINSIAKRNDLTLKSVEAESSSLGTQVHLLYSGSSPTTSATLVAAIAPQDGFIGALVTAVCKAPLQVTPIKTDQLLIGVQLVVTPSAE